VILAHEQSSRLKEGPMYLPGGRGAANGRKINDLVAQRGESIIAKEKSTDKKSSQTTRSLNPALVIATTPEGHKDQALFRTPGTLPSR
jgi:hypothetical protein